MQAEQQRLATEQAEAQRQAALRAEQERIAAQQAEQARIAEAQRQAAEQERLRIQRTTPHCTTTGRGSTTSGFTSGTTTYCRRAS